MLATLALQACEKGTRVFYFKQTRPELMEVSTSEQEGATSGQVTKDATIKQRVMVASGKGVDGANIVFPVGSVPANAKITITQGANLATTEFARVLGATSFPSKANSVLISSDPKMDTLTLVTISLPLPTTSTLHMSLASDSNWVVLYESTHAKNSNRYTSGLIPKSAFTIDGGMAKITATKFGTYQVAEIDPAITTAIEKAGTVAESIAALPPPPLLTSVATPTFDVTSGTYNSAQAVTITSTTSGSSIYYTTDGSTPSSSSTLYTAPVTISATTTLKAIAIKSGSSDSAVASADYVLNITTVSTPTFSPAAGAYGPSQNVTVSTLTTGATIYYTTDGSTPTMTSSIFSSPLTISTTKTLKALAVKSGLLDSAIGSAVYTINGAVQTPVASVVTGSFTNDQSVTFATVPMAASIYYTIDGTTPTTGSTLYTGTHYCPVNLRIKSAGYRYCSPEFVWDSSQTLRL
jgi:hypothetical protein